MSNYGHYALLSKNINVVYYKFCSRCGGTVGGKGNVSPVGAGTDRWQETEIRQTIQMPQQSTTYNN